MISLNNDEFDELEAMTEGQYRDSEHSRDDFYGDPMNEEPDDKITRIYIHNVN